MEYSNKIFPKRLHTFSNESKHSAYSPINALDDRTFLRDSTYKQSQYFKTQSTFIGKNIEKDEQKQRTEKKQITPASVLDHIRSLLHKNKPHPCQDFRVVREFNEFSGKSKQFEKKIQECEKVCKFIGRTVQKLIQ